MLLRLHAAIDVSSFWGALQSILDTAVPNDACVVYRNYLDFTKTWDASDILATSKARKPCEWLQRRREVDMTPAFILSHPGIKFYQLSDVVPDSHRLQCSEFFRRYMAPDGWRYTACSLFWEAGKLHSEIAIRRTAEQGDFTPQEMTLLQRLHPHIETALRRLAALDERMAYSALRPTLLEAPTGFSRQVMLSRLTPAERELVRFVREGWSNKEIAARLDKSIRTVKTQLTSVYKKFTVRSRTRLLALMR
jgi:DNA-binding CsgD family transcriptional regulator